MSINSYDFDSSIMFMDRTQSEESVIHPYAPHNKNAMYPLYCNINHELLKSESMPSVKPPKIINGYLFGAVLGEGSYGKVKELVDENSLAKRAVKIVNHYVLRKRRNGVANLEKEIRVMSRLKHKNVVRLIETFACKEKNKTYIVMEYCFGNVETLIQSTCNHRLTESDSHDLFTQLIDGLEHIHSHGIIHNDIKPTNLLLSGNFVLKICDFGVAEELAFHREDDSICSDNGTPAFKAPEAINSNTYEFSGFKIDIFAAGVTLFYMICGKLPWEAPSQQVLALFKKICEDEYAFPSYIHPTKEVQELIAAMLHKDPLARASLQEIKKYFWFDKFFQNEYARFQVVNYDAFYPKSVIKQKLEMLFGEILHFKSFERQNKCVSETNGTPLKRSISAPDISPLPLPNHFGTNTLETSTNSDVQGFVTNETPLTSTVTSTTIKGNITTTTTGAESKAITNPLETRKITITASPGTNTTSRDDLSTSNDRITVVGGETTISGIEVNTTTSTIIANSTTSAINGNNTVPIINASSTISIVNGNSSTSTVGSTTATTSNGGSVMIIGASTASTEAETTETTSTATTSTQPTTTTTPTITTTTNTTSTTTTTTTSTTTTPLSSENTELDELTSNATDTVGDTTEAGEKKSKFPWWIVAVAGGVALIVIGGVLLAFFLKKKKKGPEGRKDIRKVQRMPQAPPPVQKAPEATMERGEMDVAKEERLPPQLEHNIQIIPPREAPNPAVQVQATPPVPYQPVSPAPETSPLVKTTEDMSTTPTGSEQRPTADEKTTAATEDTGTTESTATGPANETRVRRMVKYGDEWRTVTRVPSDFSFDVSVTETE